MAMKIKLEFERHWDWQVTPVIKHNVWLGFNRTEHKYDVIVHDDITSWLMSQGVGHVVEVQHNSFEGSEVFISFSKKSDAMLFKLRWL